VNYLVDTNILLRLAQREHPHHRAARVAVLGLREQENVLRCAVQNCIEFWNVSTRPANRNGLGLTLIEAEKQLRMMERLFPVLPENPTVYREWRRLVVQFGVSGIQVHDARLVAAMKINDLTHILTFNAADFLRYKNEGIVVIAPQVV